jgi:hypothetical protein
MKTDTPRTDLKELELSEVGYPQDFYALGDLCRELELELTASQAEVERLTKRPFGCKCETLREKALGDGCDECNKALVIEMLTDEQDELEVEVERLIKLLHRAIEIAETSCKYLDTGGSNEDELYSGKEGWVTETEIDEVCARLALIKEEIK